MSNGNLNLINNQYQGDIRTYAFALKFWLEKNEKAQSEKAPAHVIMARSPAGHTCQIGVAWEHVIQKGATRGLKMFQLQIADPSFGENPLYFSAFPNSSNTGWDVTAERKRGVEPVTEVVAA